MPTPKSIIDLSVSILNESFDKYKTACYGDRELPADQLHEVRRAYLSGMIWYVSKMEHTSLMLPILCEAVAKILELDSNITAAIDKSPVKDG
jgi:hypothetical protein